MKNRELAPPEQRGGRGLFRYQAQEALKAQLLSGEKLRGYDEILNKLDNNLSSTNAALELMEFQERIKQVGTAARTYIDKWTAFSRGS